MDAANIGELIASLRKKKGLTQSELAEKLNVSNKAVSRWESGKGYPEVTQFPVIASFFGVTVDYLMTGKRRGFAFAGNILADIVKTVDCYPREGTTAHIKDSTIAVGGAVPNVAMTMAKIDSTVPISAIGMIGDDEYGRYVLLQMSRLGIDCSQVTVSRENPTSFSDIISVSGGERTIFHKKGANAEFSPDNVDISVLGCSILHIGYILLLDSFDREEIEYGTVMARFLHDVQESGIKTSIDVVSDMEADCRAKILPAVKYCNYVIINEIECCMLTGLSPYREDSSIDIENIKASMIYLAENGVKEKVIVHCKKAGFCYDVQSKSFCMVPSLKIPKELIRGSVGAGDSFCAGALYGIYNGYTDSGILEFASSAAASNLFAENSVDGILNKNELNKLEKKFGRIEK